MLTIWDLLASGVIVAHDEQLGMLVLWNKSLTLRLFRAILVGNKHDLLEGYCFEEVDVITLVQTRRRVGRQAGTWSPIYKDMNITESRARKRAEKWLKDIAAEDR